MPVRGKFTSDFYTLVVVPLPAAAPPPAPSLGRVLDVAAAAAPPTCLCPPLYCTEWLRWLGAPRLFPARLSGGPRE